MSQVERFLTRRLGTVSKDQRIDHSRGFYNGKSLYEKMQADSITGDHENEQLKKEISFTDSLASPSRVLCSAIIHASPIRTHQCSSLVAH